MVIIGCLIFSIASATTSCKKRSVAREEPAVEEVEERVPVEEEE